MIYEVKERRQHRMTFESRGEYSRFLDDPGTCKVRIPMGAKVEVDGEWVIIRFDTQNGYGTMHKI